jgi:hypothetical protein
MDMDSYMTRGKLTTSMFIKIKPFCTLNFIAMQPAGWYSNNTFVFGRYTTEIFARLLIPSTNINVCVFKSI